MSQLTPNQLQALLRADEVKELLAILQENKSLWEQATQAVKSGNYEGAQAVLQPLLSKSAAPELARKLQQQLG